MTRKDALRLEYLDGLRAIAALYVVLFHAGLGFSPNPGQLPAAAQLARRILCYGHDAVAVFIVLSGYCLMLPVSRAEGHIVRGVQSYFGRRAWRILPPYLAALLGSLVLLGVVPALRIPSGTIWDDSLPAFSFGPIASHLLLVHNLFPAWVHTINGPLWSVATEWQIYFFFPLFLLPLWRRFGALCSTLAGLGLGVALLGVAPGVAHASCSWYLGLFALGMAAAGINFASRPAESRLREHLPWGYLTCALLVATAIAATVFVKLWFRFMPASDVLVGVTTASGLVYLTRHALRPATEPQPLSLRVLQLPALVLLGRFSYSLYLTHLPLVALCYFALQQLSLTPGTALLALLVLSLPLSLLSSYGFFRLFEQRFVGTPPVFFRPARDPK